MGSGWTNIDLLWLPLRKKFRDQGFDTAFLKYPYRGYGNITDTARMVARYVGAVREYYDHICYLGHSMGGLVGRYLIQRLPEGNCIDSYISLASPHQGVFLANYAPSFSYAAKQMGTKSNFITKLNATPWPENIPALAISAGWEEIVWPARNTKLLYPNIENVTIPYTTHITLPLDPRTFTETHSWLVFSVLEDELLANRPPGLMTDAELQ